MSFKCLECNGEFNSERSLHAHLKKHRFSLADYYQKHHPRKNLLTGTLLQFKSLDTYFTEDFDNREQLLRWCAFEEPETVKQYVKELLHRRIVEKELKHAPCHLEIETSTLPSIDIYKKLYGSYSAVCKEIGVDPILNRPLPKDFHNDYSEATIFVDTREQQPLKFKNEREVKLDFGDYTAGGSFYTKTFVDRKSESDFKGTLVGENLDRFRRELERCKQMDSYLFVVVESSLDKIETNNAFGPHKSNLKFIYHNMRLLLQEFGGYCQFVFSGSRKNSAAIIPKLLVMGPKLWNVDIQYFIDKDSSWLGSKENKNEKALIAR